METYLINGKTYQRLVEKQSKKPKAFSKLYATMALIGGFESLYGLQGTVGSNKPANNGISDETLIKEFELIQNKKSQLSRNQRDFIEHKFNQNFKEVFISEEYKYVLKIVLPVKSEEIPKVLYFDKNNWFLTKNPEEATRYKSETEERYLVDLISLKSNVSEKAVIWLVELSQEKQSL